MSSRQSTLIWTCLLLALLSVLVSPIHAATKANYKTAKTLESRAHKFSSGHYYIRNVATGQYLYFTHTETSSDQIQNIVPSSKHHSKIELKQHSHSSKLMRLSVSYNDLDYCLSAQWGSASDGDGVDVAGVMYKCVVDPLIDSSLEKTKQHWLLVSARSLSHKNHSGRWFIIPYDHISDMQTKALEGKSVSTAGGAHSTRLQTLSKTSKAQQWTIHHSN